MKEPELYLRQWRMIRGMTQEKLARRANLRRATINDIERGRSYPKEETLEAILKALNIKQRHLERDPFARFNAVMT